MRDENLIREGGTVSLWRSIDEGATLAPSLCLYDSWDNIQKGKVSSEIWIVLPYSKVNMMTFSF